MSMSRHQYPLTVSQELLQLIRQEIQKADHDPTHGTILNFRDPGYSAERGGFHPVEIAVTPKMVLVYITDFAFVGAQPFAELAKEIDFDFQSGVLEHMGRVFPIEHGRDLYGLWEQNFLAYHAMGVYQVAVSSLE